MFFFEKKNQKTFIHAFGACATQMDESLFASFFLLSPTAL